MGYHTWIEEHELYSPLSVPGSNCQVSDVAGITLPFQLDRTKEKGKRKCKRKRESQIFACCVPI